MQLPSSGSNWPHGTSEFRFRVHAPLKRTSERVVPFLSLILFLIPCRWLIMLKRIISEGEMGGERTNQAGLYASLKSINFDGNVVGARGERIARQW